MKINSAQAFLLRTLTEHGGEIARGSYPAQMTSYKARDRSKRQGLITFSQGHWRITDLGKQTFDALPTAGE